MFCPARACAPADAARLLLSPLFSFWLARFFIVFAFFATPFFLLAFCCRFIFFLLFAVPRLAAPRLSFRPLIFCPLLFLYCPPPFPALACISPTVRR